ncbi:hypothetical protein NLG97_g4931 [Lecanicillium saksenae]|uniref:Uncharacterized protein n=1 Tax=Lecanicillium saksenae TaxID=468837 RepID=A0ACC1QTX8_9HYPO|nr:hypothetical protein NLG97_g4931 [Lecanicillium saksenae]
MQIATVAVFLAAAVAAAPSPSPNSPQPDQFGVRYTDRHCKKMHSLPNRNFSMMDCIEKDTVGSVLVEDFGICDVFTGHQCKGTRIDGGLIPDDRCIDTSKGNWKKAKSFRCWMGNN